MRILGLLLFVVLRDLIPTLAAPLDQANASLSAKVNSAPTLKEKKVQLRTPVSSDTKPLTPQLQQQLQRQQAVRKQILQSIIDNTVKSDDGGIRSRGDEGKQQSQPQAKDSAKDGKINAANFKTVETKNIIPGNNGIRGNINNGSSGNIGNHGNGNNGNHGNGNNGNHGNGNNGNHGTNNNGNLGISVNHSNGNNFNHGTNNNGNSDNDINGVKRESTSSGNTYNYNTGIVPPGLISNANRGGSGFNKTQHDNTDVNDTSGTRNGSGPLDNKGGNGNNADNHSSGNASQGAFISHDANSNNKTEKRPTPKANNQGQAHSESAPLVKFAPEKKPTDGTQDLSNIQMKPASETNEQNKGREQTPRKKNPDQGNQFPSNEHSNNPAKPMGTVDAFASGQASQESKSGQGPSKPDQAHPQLISTPMKPVIGVANLTSKQDSDGVIRSPSLPLDFNPIGPFVANRTSNDGSGIAHQPSPLAELNQDNQTHINGKLKNISLIPVVSTQDQIPSQSDTTHVHDPIKSVSSQVDASSGLNGFNLTNSSGMVPPSPSQFNNSGQTQAKPTLINNPGPVLPNPILKDTADLAGLQQTVPANQTVNPGSSQVNKDNLPKESPISQGSVPDSVILSDDKISASASSGKTEVAGPAQTSSGNIPIPPTNNDNIPIPPTSTPDKLPASEPISTVPGNTQAINPGNQANIQGSNSGIPSNQGPSPSNQASIQTPSPGSLASNQGPSPISLFNPTQGKASSVQPFQLTNDNIRGLISATQANH